MEGQLPPQKLNAPYPIFPEGSFPRRKRKLRPMGMLFIATYIYPDLLSEQPAP